MVSSEFALNHVAARRMRDFSFPWLAPGKEPVSTAGAAQDLRFSFGTVERPESTSVKTSESFPLLVSLEAHDREIQSRAERYRDTVSAYKNRISVLKEQAELDGYSLNPSSKAAFLEFLEKNPLIRRGRLVLMENGNLRAVWAGENRAHIGLQFLDKRAIQYVIFKQRKPSVPVSRVTGRDTMEGISKQIEAFDLRSVLYP